MSNERVYLVLAATPDPSLPHRTRAEEIAELTEYLAVERAYPEGTMPLIVDAAGKADNQTSIFVEKDSTNGITGFYAYVSGEWVKYKISTDDLDETMLDTMLKVSGSKLTVNLDGETLLLSDADGDGKQSIYVKPKVDGTTITIDEETGNLTVPEEGVSGIDFVRVTTAEEQTFTVTDDWISPKTQLELVELVTLGSSMVVSDEHVEIKQDGVYIASWEFAGQIHSSHCPSSIIGGIGYSQAGVDYTYLAGGQARLALPYVGGTPDYHYYSLHVTAPFYVSLTAGVFYVKPLFSMFHHTSAYRAAGRYDVQNDGVGDYIEIPLTTLSDYTFTIRPTAPTVSDSFAERSVLQIIRVGALPQ